AGGRGLRSAPMLELLAAGAALAGRALLQAADTALLAVAEDELRAEEQHHPLRTRRLLELKREPESTAAALRGASSALLAFAAVACAIVVGDRAVHPAPATAAGDREDPQRRSAGRRNRSTFAGAGARALLVRRAHGEGDHGPAHAGRRGADRRDARAGHRAARGRGPYADAG